MNKCFSFLLTLMSVILCSNAMGQDPAGETAGPIAGRRYDPATFMWYDKPAAKWEEALPVGNGRLGAMVYGSPGMEHLQINEDTYWTGGPYNTIVQGGFKHLREIQELVFSGRYEEAQKLFGRYLMGYPVEQMKYQSIGDLYITFTDRPEPSGYVRWLDLSEGVTGTEFTSGGVTFRETVFASAPDSCIVIRLTAGRKGMMRLKIALHGVRNQAHSNYATDYFRMDTGGNNELLLTGKSADYLGVEGKLRYLVAARVFNEGGTTSSDGSSIIVEKADAVTICIAASTNFNNYRDVTGDPEKRVSSVFRRIGMMKYEELYSRSVKDYSSFFERVDLKLKATPDSYLPTDQRIKGSLKNNDPSLASLIYQFGRYILISSSRPGTQPANLQGIWNNSQNPNWDSKYTTNINTEMNYWIAESGNLAECAEPLIKMVGELTDYGSQVAREHYGCKGWVFHQNTDLWRVAAPMDGPTWGTFTTGGAWLVTHLWEHYLYKPDSEYLEDIYPVMKGAIEFFLDFLVTHPNGKWLVTNPSTSPENFPAREGNGRYFDETTGSYLPGTSICAGSAIDMQILNDLFGYFTAAADILGRDDELKSRTISARERLVPPLVGSDSLLQEWTDDWGQTEKPHRHLSHLYGLYPGNVLSPLKTPGLIDPVKRVLEQRTDGSAGWSRPWKMACWARLYDGNRALKILKQSMQEQTLIQLFSLCYTAMQVDASLGNSAAISEMLLQSHDGFIHLLPALPAEWDEGEISGIRARGGFEISMSWKAGRPVSADLISHAGENLRIKTAGDFRVISEGRQLRTKKLPGGITEVATIKNKRYSLKFL